MIKNIFFGVTVFLSFLATAQTDFEQVKQTVDDYIQGTSYTYPDRLKKAFHPESNLYLSQKDNDFWVVPSKEYIAWFAKKEPGTFTKRLGKILQIEVLGDIATAKAEILITPRKLRFVDAFLLKKVGGKWQIIAKTASNGPTEKNGTAVLFFVSNAHTYGDTELGTGNSFAEIAYAYEEFEKAGINVSFVSPDGGAVSLVYINTSDPLQKKYVYDPDLMWALQHTQKPEEVNPKDYSAVYYVGGGSAMFQVPESKAIQQLALRIYEENEGIVAAVCHGTAGIVNLKTKNGDYLFAGKNVSGYPEAYENQSRPHFKTFPFLIQKTIEERGGHFKVSPKGKAHVEVDGRLVTGQNYQSSAGVAQAIIAQLKPLTQQ
ncbi:nuclear transport factor 2 family protein [Sediminicola luteus]|uniref:nuclear transport factor 2 family protein n=1 Tax=Sediminicola luteus TaxID=319238 RepID=UPI000BE582D7|nr:nuclear transport factor 2 family protein [Sediminicola luteus]